MDLLNLVARLSLDSSQYEKGIQNAQKKSKSFGDVIGKTVKTAVAIGGAVSAGGTAMMGFATKASNVTDNIDKQSQRLGMSRKAYQEWDYVLSQAGADIDSMKIGMKTMTNQIGKATASADTAGTAFEGLGISFDDIKGKSREDIFSMAISALQGMEDQTKKASIAQKLFGRSGQELIPLLNQSAESTDQLKNKAHDLGLVMSDEAIDAGVNFHDTMDSLQRALGTMTSKIGVAVMPTVENFANYIIGNMPKIQRTFSKVFKVIERVVTVAITTARDFYSSLMDAVDYIQDEFSPVVEALGDLFGVLGDMFAPIIDYLTDYVESGDASTDSTNLLKDAVSLLADGLQVVIEKITDFVTWLNNGSTGADVFKAVVVGITGAFITYKAIVIASTVATKAHTLATALAEGATKAMTVAQGALNAVLNANPLAIVAIAVVGLVTALITLYNTNEDFRKLVQKVWATIKKTVLGVIDAIKKGFESWVFVIKQVWGKIKSVLSPVADWIGDKFTSAVNKIKSAFSGVVSFFKGIWSGIKGAFSKVTDWFKDTFSKAWQAVKDVFSTGGKVFEGIKEGILGVFKTVVNGLIDGINKVIKVPFDGINTALSKIKNVKIGPAKPFKKLVSTIDVPEIPKLAKGAVIGPNDPFLAMLGDQKKGINIETPLDTMVDAFNMSLDSRKTSDEGIQLLRRISARLEDLDLQESITGAVQGLEFRANEREVARVVKKYANA